MTHLSSDHKFSSSFCGPWFQCQHNFQRLCKLIWIDPVCMPPSGQSMTWTVFYLFSSQKVWSPVQCQIHTCIITPFLRSLEYFSVHWKTFFQCLGPSSMRTEREKASEAHPTYWNYCFSDWKRRFSHSVLVFYYSPVATAATSSLLWTGTHENIKKKKNKNGVFLYTFLSFWRPLSQSSSHK